MANAKKCDRCGKYYDDNTKHKATLNGTRGVLIGVGTIHDMCRVKNAYDLCDPCISDFMDFMNAFKEKDDAED